jgi:hypothetical protein
MSKTHPDQASGAGHQASDPQRFLKKSFQRNSTSQKPKYRSNHSDFEKSQNMKVVHLGLRNKTHEDHFFKIGRFDSLRHKTQTVIKRQKTWFLSVKTLKSVGSQNTKDVQNKMRNKTYVGEKSF